MTATVPPLVVVESLEAARDVAEELEAEGWRTRSGFALDAAGWDLSGLRLVCVGPVSGAGDAADALLAASRGAGLILVDKAEPPVSEQLVEDLTRFGPVEHRSGPEGLPVGLTREERRLLELLANGLSVGNAARALHISRRTADRRLARAREILGVQTTAEAVLLISRVTHSRDGGVPGAPVGAQGQSGPI